MTAYVSVIQVNATSGTQAPTLVPYPGSGTQFNQVVSSAMGATVALGANTYSTGVSLSIPAGTWLISGQMLLGRNTASSTIFTGKITDGTVFASGQISVPALTSSYATLALTTVVQYGATSTLSFQAAPNFGSCFIRAQPWQNAAGSTATWMQAVQIG